MKGGDSPVECVPNFSDGRDPRTLAEIRAAIESVPGARVLDASQDRDHDRAVVTLVAGANTVVEAVLAAARIAVERIDLTRHSGVHPRMGALDVCPLVPLGETTSETCIARAHELGRRLGDELSVPVYFYGEAALSPERRHLPDVRRGGFERIREEIGRDPRRAPDAGPRAVHPTAGATAVGVRGFLIAFNVLLDEADPSLARRIARRVRESDGGLPGIRALGLPLPERGASQVSVNVCDYRRTGLVALFDAIRDLALEAGVTVLESELVGLAPRAALDERVARHVRLSGFDPARHLVEEALLRRS